MPDFHVMPSPDAQWEVRAAESGEVLSHHTRKEEAEIHAKQLAREQGGGEVRVHDVEGEIEETETVD